MAASGMENLVLHHAGVDGFGFSATACGGTVHLEAVGTRSPESDGELSILAVTFALSDAQAEPCFYFCRDFVVRDLTEFCFLGRTDRKGVLGSSVANAGFPPECAEAVDAFCLRAAKLGMEMRCDAVSVTVEMRVRVSGAVRLRYAPAMRAMVRHEECMICLEEFADGDAVERLECSHAFHEPCLRRWMMETAACPCCRTAIWWQPLEQAQK